MNTGINNMKVKAVQEPGYAYVWYIQDEQGLTVAHITVNKDAEAWANRIESAMNEHLVPATTQPEGAMDQDKQRASEVLAQLEQRAAEHETSKSEEYQEYAAGLRDAIKALKPYLQPVMPEVPADRNGTGLVHPNDAQVVNSD